MAPSHHPLTHPLLPHRPTPPPPSPYQSARLLSRLAFLWLHPLLRLGSSRALQLADIPALPAPFRAEALHPPFAQAWDDGCKHQLPSRPPSVTRALLHCFWKLGLLTGFLALVRTLALAAGPICLLYVVEYASGEQLFQGESYVLVAGLFLSKLIESFCQRHWSFGSRQLGMQMQSAVSAAVFQKALRLSSIGKRKHTSGQIVSYIAVDAYNLGEFSWYMHYVWAMPLQLILGIIILFAKVGLASVPGLVIIALAIVLNIPLARSLQECHGHFIAAQAQRLRATTEILHSMKVIKLQAWEDHFRSYIQSLRDAELEWLAKSQRRRGVNVVLYWMAPTFIGSVIFATCIWTNESLTAVVIFTVLATFRVIQDAMRAFPEVLASAIQVTVSLDRLGNFLREHELPNDAVERVYFNPELAIRMEGVSASWEPESPRPTLRAISLQVRPGQKVAVCGAVGSGKSSLLYSILGEVPKLSGHVKLCGSVAYVAQGAWVQSETVRENILFGKGMEEERYRRTLRACALEKDIESFTFGDETEIGERGINMSGGQKQRIQLARAIYSDADVYLLDDPFSAVDAQTASTLFKECVMGALSNKTVVLVTHQIEFLPTMDCILVMQGGEIKQMGTYEELLSAGENFEQLVYAHKEALTTAQFGETPYTNDSFKSQSTGTQNNLNGKVITSVDTPSGVTQLVQDEEKETGKMGFKPYIAYIIVPKGFWIFIFLALTQATFLVSQNLSNFWLATEVSDSQVSTVLLISVYAALSIFCGALIIVRTELFVSLGLKASKEFSYGMICNLFKAPMSFFDSMPTGRILSRASTDLSVVDLDMPFCFGYVVVSGMDLLAILIVFAVVMWEILLFAVPMVFLVQQIQRYHIKSSRELIRLNGITKAPIVNFSGETIQGAAVIRAFEMEERFKRKNFELINNDASLYFHNHAAMEWLIQRLEILSSVVLCASGLLLLVFPSDNLSSGTVGLALYYALALYIQQVFWVQWECKLVNYIVSVERINQYLKLPSEATFVIDSSRPPHQWPCKGRVALLDLKIRYRANFPLVLHGITCVFEGGQKVGIVGRTGSGKTTLISALFRIVEPAGGKIIIDDVDICSIGLHDLRSRLGIIPQEPTLFRGTVRINLDPLGQYTDDEIWKALDRCQLGRDIRESPLKLDSPVSDEGENWSTGQRQLFCLGRVLLKQSRLLILDEATASIDSQTDALLQKVLRSEFKNSTVITVAHRIPTVIDCDMVLALGDGHVIEYNSPTKLLGDENSLFAKLVSEYWSHDSL